MTAFLPDTNVIVLIAATALSRYLTLATRNVRDFLGLDVRLFDPWSE